jgi:hypothetical protein
MGSAARVACGHQGCVTLAQELLLRCPPAELAMASGGGGSGSSAAGSGSTAMSTTWSSRPLQGSAVPLLLTGGADGSLRAWDLRRHTLGACWAAAAPHLAPVQALALPPASARLPWSGCVLSVCARGVVAMTCLVSGSTRRTFQGWGLAAPPAQVAWSTTRCDDNLVMHCRLMPLLVLVLLKLLLCCDLRLPCVCMEGLL